MKKIFAIILALAVSLSLALTACNSEGETPKTDPPASSAKLCEVEVTCGEGGTYSLSPSSPYRVGDEVTLTLTPYSGYRAGEVKINGAAAAVAENKCAFTLAGDTQVDISFAALAAHKVTVNCDEGASYKLSPNRSEYYEGTEVTLAVTVGENYLLNGVLVNGAAVELKSDNTYAFTVEKATVIDIHAEDTRYKRVSVTCGEGGSYSLSPEGPSYLNGTRVTLTVSPEEGYRVGKVLINGAETPLTGLSCTFTADKHTAVEISFVEMGSVFPAELMGLWKPYIESGAVGEDLTVGQDSVTFEGKECVVAESEGVLTFTYTDDEGDSTEYTASYRLLREGKYLFTISFEDLADHTTTTAYYLKDGVDYYTYSFPSTFVGEWDVPDGGAQAITITEDNFLRGTSRAIVMSYDEELGRLHMMGVGGNEFTLYKQGANLAYAYTSSNGNENVVYYNRVVGLDPVLIPQYAGTYTSKDGANILVVNEDGTAKYSTNSGSSWFENVVFRPTDKFGQMKNSLTMQYGANEATADFVTDAGLGMRVWVRRNSSDEGVQLYASDYKEPYVKVSVEIIGGVGGSYTITPDVAEGQDGYTAGVTVTVTITADEGYIIDTYESRTVSGGWTKVYVSLNGPETTYRRTIAVTDRLIENYRDFDSTFGIRVTFKQSA